MPETLFEFITIYGPIGLGWPVAFMLWLRIVKMQEKMLEIVDNNTKALTTLATLIKHG